MTAQSRIDQGLRQRFADITTRIGVAAGRANRSPTDIRLIAITKTQPASLIKEALAIGASDFGENRVQEAAEKIDRITGSGLCWHLIGHLQSNKARHALRIFDYIHTVDSVELAARLDRIAGEIGRTPSVLAQVKLGDEPAKSGAAPDTLPAVIEALDSAANLKLRGLMVIPPLSESTDSARGYFRTLRQILEGVNRGRPRERRLAHLSMGMSGDYETAVEEGATMVRVGTAIFGSRLQ